MDYEELENLTKVMAKKIAGIDDIKIKFSNRIKKCHALCYWHDDPKAIYFNKQFVDLNCDNIVVLNELVVHECIHLLPDCVTHNKKFINQCKKYGISLYGYSVPYISVKPLFATYCNNCLQYRSFYSKPHRMVCKQCGNKLKIIDHRK